MYASFFGFLVLYKTNILFCALLSSSQLRCPSMGMATTQSMPSPCLSACALKHRACAIPQYENKESNTVVAISSQKNVGTVHFGTELRCFVVVFHRNCSVCRTVHDNAIRTFGIVCRIANWSARVWKKARKVGKGLEKSPQRRTWPHQRTFVLGKFATGQ
jgi:hypothetical protein